MASAQYAKLTDGYETSPASPATPGMPGSPFRQRVSTFYKNLKRTKTVQAIQDEEKAGQSDGHGAPGLQRVLSLVDITAYGIGSTVGAGVFVITGVAAKESAGPALVLSFLCAAIACLFSGLCYCEFATRVPVAGSAYTYAYATMGELMGWFIGWNLTLEYGISASAVARGWAGYVMAMFDSFGAPLPGWMSGFALPGIGGSCSILGLLIVVLCTLLLCFGVKESAKFNVFITCLNLCVIIFVIIMGSFYVDTANWKNFTPFGFSGIFQGSAKVFFSYIGFDTVSALAQEVKNPQRDLPLGISLTLGIATSLYCAISLVITGMVPYLLLDKDAPLAQAFSSHGVTWAADIVAVGSVTTLTATTLCSLLGQPRIYMRMAQDGLLFSMFGRIHEKYQTPLWGTIFTGCLSGALAFLLDINTLADMISIGTLLAFNMVCVGVMVMRYETSPSRRSATWLIYAIFAGSVLVGGLSRVPSFGNHGTLYLCIAMAVAGIVFPMAGLWYLPQGEPASVSSFAFSCPLVPLVPTLGIVINTYLLFQLELSALYRLLVWTALGMLIYFVYGYRHSKLGRQLRAEANEREQAGTLALPQAPVDLEADPVTAPLIPGQPRSRASSRV